MKNKIKMLVKRVLKNVDLLLIKLLHKSQFSANIYYFFKPSFRRENKTVLSGRYQYYLNSKKTQGNLFFLRRSIHRIEKGIIMRPRREVFAESYIESTVDNYIKLKNSKENSSSLNWAHDVLINYFDVVNSDKSLKVSRSKEKFLNSLNTKEKYLELIPYKRNIKTKPNISIDELKELSKYRRSVRWFQDKEIEHTKIDEAIKVAAYSPSACNRIPYQFKVFDKKEKVIDIAKSAMGTTGYADNIPTIIAVVGDTSAYPSERDRHLIYIDSSLAAMSFVYGLEVQGISSCVINWPDIEKREKRISKILNLKPYERVTMLIAVGYADPDGMVAYSHKKSLDEVRSYN